MVVGIRELKQHLSEYLRRVGEGEVIYVTDRGRPIATLNPVTSGNPLERGVEEGWIRPPLADRAIGRAPRAVAERRVLDVLREDRGE
jgi:prevent-host-death family protein